MFRYSDICNDIGLERFSGLDLQEEIDTCAGRLSQLGVECGQIPLSTLLTKANLLVDSNTEILSIHLGPLQRQDPASQGSSHQGGPRNSPDPRTDWMQFVNFSNANVD
jgi:hypothetical protein